MMQIDVLLEKKEAIYVQMLRTIVLSGGQITLTALRETTGLSKTAFEQYLKDIEQLGKNETKYYSITYRDYTIQLDFSPTINLEMVMMYLIEQSSYFQLLQFILLHPTFTTVQLMNHLGMSESTVFRKIKEVNVILKEFQVQIKNGELQGEELQIRYVYYQLFSLMMPYRTLDSFLTIPDYDPFIRALSRTLDCQFSRTQKEKITLWWYLTQKRWLAKNPNFERLAMIFRPFLEDEWYKKIDRFMSLYLSRIAIENNIYEAIMLYIFVISFEILGEEDFYQYDLSRSKRLPTARLDLYLRETILVDYRPKRFSIELEKKVGYQLAQVDHEVYFFMGKIEMYDRENLLTIQRRLLGHKRSRLLQKMMTIVFEQLAPEHHPNNSLQDFLLVNYASILTMIEFSSVQPITIGLDFEQLPIYRFLFFQLVQMELKPLLGVEVERYQANRVVDIVISPRPKPTYLIEEPRYWYAVSEFDSTYDLQKISQLIESIRLERT